MTEHVILFFSHPITISKVGLGLIISGTAITRLRRHLARRLHETF